MGYVYKLTCVPRDFKNLPPQLQKLFDYDSEKFWAHIGSVDQCGCQGGYETSSCPTARLAATTEYLWNLLHDVKQDEDLKEGDEGDDGMEEYDVEQDEDLKESDEGDDGMDGDEHDDEDDDDDDDVDEYDDDDVDEYDYEDDDDDDDDDVDEHDDEEQDVVFFEGRFGEEQHGKKESEVESELGEGDSEEESEISEAPTACNRIPFH